MKRKIFLLLTVLFSFSCSQDDFTENEASIDENINSEFSKGEALLIDPETESLTLNKQGHAWVCEGYSTNWYEGIISMVIDRKYGIPSDPSSHYFDYEFHAIPPTASIQEEAEVFYMNMGWEGLNNGWYRANSYNASHPDRSFLKDQKMITVSR